MLKELYGGIFLNTRDIARSSYIWNTLSALLFALQSAVMMMVIMRTNGPNEAGVFSIAYAVASMMIFIGEFGVRKYQASDVQEECSFSDYYSFRLLSCGAMILACVGYGVYGLVLLGYSWSKFTILLLVCAVRLVEAFNDVFFGRFQQMHRLDVAAKTNSFRILLGMVCYGIALVVTRNFLLSTCIWVAAVLVGLAGSSLLVAPQFCKIQIHFRKEKIRKIFWECLPLFIATFLLLYIGNAPKYAIDASLSDEHQATYNIIFMPVFVIGMLANLIFNPILVDLADAWEECRFKWFKHAVRRQVGIITGLTALAVAVALTIGCPVLGLLFHADVSDQKPGLVILMIGGGMLALVNLITVVATIIRAQKHLVIGYILVSIAAFLFSPGFVQRYQLMGASVLYTALLTILAVLFMVILIHCIRKGIRKKEEAETQ